MIKPNKSCSAMMRPPRRCASGGCVTLLDVSQLCGFRIDSVVVRGSPAGENEQGILTGGIWEMFFQWHLTKLRLGEAGRMLTHPAAPGG
jgi:hypothetical protein